MDDALLCHPYRTFFVFPPPYQSWMPGTTSSKSIQVLRHTQNRGVAAIFDGVGIKTFLQGPAAIAFAVDGS